MTDKEQLDNQQGGTDRTRMIVDTSESLRKAVQLRKLKLPRGTTLSDVVNGVLEGTMPPLTRELGELRGFDHESSEQTQPKTKKKL